MRRLVSAVLTFLLLALAAPDVAVVAAHASAAPTLDTRLPVESGCTVTDSRCRLYSMSARFPDRGHSSSPITLKVEAGYNGQYRRTAWVPVRVSVRNSGSTLVRGTIVIPEHSRSRVWISPAFHSLY